MYKPKNFKAHELVDAKLYATLMHDTDLIYKLFDPEILKWAQWMRERYGPFLINDWWNRGNSEWRGLRTPRSKYFSKTSMHAHGQAIDLLPVGSTPSAKEIIADLKSLGKVPHITRVEDLAGMTWIHGDTKKTGKKNTHFFLP